MDITNRQSDSPKLKAFRQNAPPAADSAPGRLIPADETSLSNHIFYLAARKIPPKGDPAPKKRAAKNPRRGKVPFHSHDLLFREIFSKKRFAPDMLLLSLSRERLEFLDLKTLKPQPPVLFTSEGRERRADLIFSISTKPFPQSEESAGKSSRKAPLRLQRYPAGGRAGKRRCQGESQGGHLSAKPSAGGRGQRELRCCWFLSIRACRGTSIFCSFWIICLPPARHGGKKA